MKNKCLILAGIFLVMAATVGYSQENLVAEETVNTGCINLFTPDVNHTLIVSEEAHNYHNLTHFTLGSSVILKADMKEIKVNSGLKIDYRGFNMAYEGIYAPTFFRVLNAGVRIVNHYDWDFTDYFEFDFLGGLYLEYNPFTQLSLSTSLMYQKKCALMYQIAQERGFILSNCPAFEVMVTYRPVEWINTTFSVSSFDFFKYYLTFSPNFKLSAEFQVNPFLSFGVSSVIQYVDFLTLSANFNNISAVLSILWRF